mmetsp:Transcript_8244/g.18392  ORF Transcript_8244/g.18392 Transcript_8244/m.18392 type:complete len:84 (+) Transcript_8244:1650-1901(+)
MLQASKVAQRGCFCRSLPSLAGQGREAEEGVGHEEDEEEEEEEPPPESNEKPGTMYSTTRTSVSLSPGLRNFWAPESCSPALS